MLHAGVVRKDVVAARTVTEEADDAGMSAVENADDAAFGALRAVTGAGAENFGEDVVAVHGVFDGIAGNKDVAGVLRGGDVGYDEAVAVVMEDEAAGEFVAAGTEGEIECSRTTIGLGSRSALVFPF